MTLTEIWKSHRRALYLVAARPNSMAYVPLGLKNWEELEELTSEDRAASDWFLAEIVAHDCDQDHPTTGLCELSGKPTGPLETDLPHICRDHHLHTFRCDKHGQVDHFVKVG